MLYSLFVFSQQFQVGWQFTDLSCLHELKCVVITQSRAGLFRVTRGIDESRMLKNHKMRNSGEVPSKMEAPMFQAEHASHLFQNSYCPCDCSSHWIWSLHIFLLSHQKIKHRWEIKSNDEKMPTTLTPDMVKSPQDVL
jgi:hypothetical protein